MVLDMNNFFMFLRLLRLDDHLLLVVHFPLLIGGAFKIVFFFFLINNLLFVVGGLSIIFNLDGVVNTVNVKESLEYFFLGVAILPSFDNIVDVAVGHFDGVLVQESYSLFSGEGHPYK